MKKVKRLNNLEIGIVVEVKGFINRIATFDNTNHATFIQNGELIKNVSVNSFIVISQGFVKIIARINSESIWDTQNSINDYKLDRRFSKNNIKRILEVQTIGYIQNNKFHSGASFLPMIGNICSIPNSDDINKIYINNYVEEADNITINVGESLIEQNNIALPINSFFASHIGIFGNTGSGKSNTLHKLHYELFSIESLTKIREQSNFLILDFNGEYIQDHSFGIPVGHDKKVYELSSRSSNSDKFPVKLSVFYNDEMLALLFQATTQTQKPFLSRVVNGQKKYGTGIAPLRNWIIYLIKQVYKGSPDANIRNKLVETLEHYFEGVNYYLQEIKRTSIHSVNNCFIMERAGYTPIYFNSDWNDAYSSTLKIEDLRVFLISSELDAFEEFEIRCKLQLLNDLLYGNVVSEHIDPLIKRIEARLKSISNYIELKDSFPEQTFLQIISLKNLNQEAKKVCSLIISKMYFDYHKNANEGRSFHLIIDEAHNILSGQSASEHGSWKDYRLEMFEEIIKEGRKFSFFLTLSSQRPADISPTILSQVHNFFLHKLVNERDLQIIDNSISTLDKISKSMLPILSQGVCIISGTAVSMPITVKIDFIEDIKLRPKSDTITLTDTWK
ncbi:DUF87 domain-containing protein [Listeria monocytogenes]|nr:DUF87 domain-containing protein [Listeria monocytogenes]